MTTRFKDQLSCIMLGHIGEMYNTPAGAHISWLLKHKIDSSYLHSSYKNSSGVSGKKLLLRINYDNLSFKKTHSNVITMSHSNL